MKIYVINLDRAVERKIVMRQGAENLGIELDFIQAVDALQITDQDRRLVDDDARRKFTPFPLTDGEIGCWLSHRKAMQALLDSGEDMAVILEDDVSLLDDFCSVLHAISISHQHFDLITLHRNYGRGEIFVPTRPLMPAFELGRIGYIQTGNVGYVVTRQAASRFLECHRKFIHAVDKELHRYWANGLDIYALSQPVILHNDAGYSYLDETRLRNSRIARPRYGEAQDLYWRFQRFKSKHIESFHKRLAFLGHRRFYVSLNKLIRSLRNVLISRPVASFRRISH